jgi:hypothetical protein
MFSERFPENPFGKRTHPSFGEYRINRNGDEVNTVYCDARRKQCAENYKPALRGAVIGG